MASTYFGGGPVPAQDLEEHFMVDRVVCLYQVHEEDVGGEVVLMSEVEDRLEGELPICTSRKGGASELLLDSVLGEELEGSLRKD